MPPTLMLSHTKNEGNLSESSDLRIFNCKIGDRIADSVIEK